MRSTHRTQKTKNKNKPNLTQRKTTGKEKKEMKTKQKNMYIEFETSQDSELDYLQVLPFIGER
jgi:hypothetical protein